MHVQLGTKIFLWKKNSKEERGEGVQAAARGSPHASSASCALGTVSGRAPSSSEAGSCTGCCTGSCTAGSCIAWPSEAEEALPCRAFT